MIFLYIILGAIAYFAIGGFLSGAMLEDDATGEHVTMWFLWPVCIVATIFTILMYFPYRLGQIMKERRKK